SQLVEVDVAGAHHRGGVLIVDQRQQQVLERGVFVVALVGERQGPMERLLEVARKSRHVSSPGNALYGPGVPGFQRHHFFSITHCNGCWCLRAKSMTCVTLVSATSYVKTPHSPIPCWCTCIMILWAVSWSLLKKRSST